LQIRYGSSNLKRTLAPEKWRRKGLTLRSWGSSKTRPPGAFLDIEVRTQSQVKIVKLRGRLGLGDSLDRAGATLNDLSEAGEKNILLDMEEVTMIDSSGIGLLVRHFTAAKQRGGALKLLKPSKMALQTLKLVRVLNLFEIFEDQQQAISSFT
jgi:anti-sigma B factor antagonist